MAAEPHDTTHVSEIQKEHPGLKMTASFGLAKYQSGLNAARLFLNADQALYQAKITRDTIQIYEKDQ